MGCRYVYGQDRRVLETMTSDGMFLERTSVMNRFTTSELREKMQEIRENFQAQIWLRDLVIHKAIECLILVIPGGGHTKHLLGMR